MYGGESPSMKLSPLFRPFSDTCIRITATTGNGLSATPIAGVRISPIATAEGNADPDPDVEGSPRHFNAAPTLRR
jgi:hypothetical protein